MQNKMNLNQIQNQMRLFMQMEMNNNNQIKLEEYEDIYNYIKEKKKKIKFIRVLDNELFKVMVPCSLRKNELYYTAKKYKKYEFSEMQLFYKGKFMNEDETSIDCINDNYEIKIVEEMHGIDFSYYDLFLSKHEKDLKINVRFSIDGINKYFVFTLNTSIEEMAKIFFYEMNIPENKRNLFQLIINGEIIDISDKSSLGKKNITDLSNIVVNRVDILPGFKPIGKIIEVLFMKNNEIIIKVNFGTLDTINSLYNFVRNNYPKKISKIKIKGKEINKNDERTLSSVGIRDNFTCYIE